MREKIRIPCDVELLTKFLKAGSIDLTGTAKIVVDCENNGKFNKVTKLSITLPDFGEIVVIHPKDRSGNGRQATSGRPSNSPVITRINPLTEAEKSGADAGRGPVVPVNGGPTGADNATDSDTSTST